MHLAKKPAEEPESTPMPELSPENSDNSPTAQTGKEK